MTHFPARIHGPILSKALAAAHFLASCSMSALATVFAITALGMLLGGVK